MAACRKTKPRLVGTVKIKKGLVKTFKKLG
jgi:hypothetical protein